MWDAPTEAARTLPPRRLLGPEMVSGNGRNFDNGQAEANQRGNTGFQANKNSVCEFRFFMECARWSTGQVQSKVVSDQSVSIEGNKVSDNGESSGRTTLACYACTKPGHFAKECTEVLFCIHCGVQYSSV
jgi:hypothetical protein